MKSSSCPNSGADTLNSGSFPAPILSRKKFLQTINYIFFIIISFFVIWLFFGQTERVVLTKGLVKQTLDTYIIKSSISATIDNIYVTEDQIVDTRQVLLDFSDHALREQKHELVTENKILKQQKDKLEKILASEQSLSNGNWPGLAETLAVDDDVKRYQANKIKEKNKLQQDLDSLALQLKHLEAEKNTVFIELKLAQKIENMHHEYALGSEDINNNSDHEKHGKNVAHIQNLQETLEGLETAIHAARNNYNQCFKYLNEFNKNYCMPYQEKLKQVTTLLEKNSLKINDIEKKIEQSEVRLEQESIIKNIIANNIGQNVNSGASLFEAIPLQDFFYIDTFISEDSFSQIQIGQTAFIKFTDQEFANYSKISGKVDFIDPSNIKAMDGKKYQFVRIYLDRKTLNPELYQKVIPGLHSKIEIVTGQTSILNSIIQD